MVVCISGHLHPDVTCKSRPCACHCNWAHMRTSASRAKLMFHTWEGWNQKVAQSCRRWLLLPTPMHESGEVEVHVFGVLVGHPSYVRVQLSEIQHDHQTLLDRIPSLPDLQSSWLLLLHCASARANYFLRVVPLVSLSGDPSSCSGRPGPPKRSTDKVKCWARWVVASPWSSRGTLIW